MTRQIMALEEMTAYLGVRKSTIYRLAREGKMPAVKVGGDWRFNRAAIETWCHDRERSRHSFEAA
jgi:excisionase family DNA binding protein